MTHDVLSKATRGERRSLLREEKKRRASGDWGAWEKFRCPIYRTRAGWLGNVEFVCRNLVFAVLIDDFDTPAGKITHLAVSSLSQQRPTWWEMQRIKNELINESATAVEVYPPQDEVVDGADMFHIWALPVGFALHCTLTHDSQGRRGAA